MEKWNGKIAVITGACSGMGAAILSKFLKHGLTVINLDINVTENTSSDDDKKSKVFHRKCDVANLDSIRESFEWIEQHFGVIHVLINNAGIFRSGKVFDDKMTETLQRLIDVNFSGVVHCTREAVKLMRKSGEHCMIVNICSLGGHIVPVPNDFNIYPATKFAIRAFSEILRQELSADDQGKIRVSNLSPNLTRTNIMDGSGFGSFEEFREKYNLRYIEPEDIAEAVCYMLSTPLNVNVAELIILSS